MAVPHRPVHGLWISSGSSRRHDPFHAQPRCPTRLRGCLFLLQIAGNDLLTSDLSRSGNPTVRVLESGAMAAVAQMPDSALVPPQNLKPEESVIGAMMLSTGAIGAVTAI